MDEHETATIARVCDAVRSALPDEMVTKVIVIAETFNSEGQRGLWIATDPDTMPWETLGMLEYAKAQEWHGDEDDD